MRPPRSLWSETLVINRFRQALRNAVEPRVLSALERLEALTRARLEREYYRSQVSGAAAEDLYADSEGVSEAEELEAEVAAETELHERVTQASVKPNVFPDAPGEVYAERLFGAGFRSPLLDDGQGSIVIQDTTEHAFFLRLCEAYRVLELSVRTVPTMIETYSRFRERKQFEETLRMRFFDGDDQIIARFDPHLSAIMNSIFNHVHELRIYLRYTDALPSTVEQRMTEDLAIMQESWELLVDGIHAKYGWNFKKI